MEDSNHPDHYTHNTHCICIALVCIRATAEADIDAHPEDTCMLLLLLLCWSIEALGGTYWDHVGIHLPQQKALYIDCLMSSVSCRCSCLEEGREA